MMMISVCVGQKKQRYICFLSVKDEDEENMDENMGCAR